MPSWSTFKAMTEASDFQHIFLLHMKKLTLKVILFVIFLFYFSFVDAVCPIEPYTRAKYKGLLDVCSHTLLPHYLYFEA